MKKVVGGDLLLQLVLTWPSWAYHVVKPYWTQVLPWSSLVPPLWLKMTGVSLTLTKCALWVLVIIDPCPCGFASDVKADPTLKLVFARKFDSIWVIVDRLTKSAHFISWTPAVTFRSMLRSTLFVCYACTGFWRWSFLVEGHSLSLTSGNNCMRPRDSPDSQFGLSPANGWPN
jgi:hypothetical protein